MKMAKASAEDLRMAMDVANVLDDIESGFFPYKFQDEESEYGERIDTDDRDQYERLIDGLQRLLVQGSIFRVIFGMAVVCDPANECIDPDADSIEHHPKRLIAEQQRDELLAALEALTKRCAMDWCNFKPEFMPPESELYIPLVDAAKKAIASAKGGAA